jgi:hypothetical protein
LLAGRVRFTSMTRVQAEQEIKNQQNPFTDELFFN